MASRFLLAVAAAASLLSSVIAEPIAIPDPSPAGVTQTSSPTYTGALRSMTSKGCFSSEEPLEDHGYYIYQSQGNCQSVCVGAQMEVMGLVNGTNCFCGNKLPAKSTLADDDKCNTPCSGYDSDNCGGKNYWQVYLSGLDSNEVDYYDGGSSSSSSLSTSTSAGTPVVVTAGGQTVIVTKGAEASSKSSGSTASKAGIAAGVVVGVVVLTAVIGGVLLFLRHKRRKEIEEEVRQRQSVNNFVAGGKVPGTSSLNDTILDPAFARRMSNGSVADNQDYSRRILQVRNPDDD
ncbi:uncharacterized protein J3D65DRAFT_160101 [Phyllosticta citribraziliensis]|uniref:WSC domain-containing protein n=1 Tax=Phyllosticta citribraziliensis TaxID=989973 RepID=A0ABR1L3Q1_9PEZI